MFTVSAEKHELSWATGTPGNFDEESRVIIDLFLTFITFASDEHPILDWNIFLITRLPHDEVADVLVLFAAKLALQEFVAPHSKPSWLRLRMHPRPSAFEQLPSFFSGESLEHGLKLFYEIIF